MKYHIVSSVKDMEKLCKGSKNEPRCARVLVNNGENEIGITSLWQLYAIIRIANNHSNIRLTGIFSECDQDKILAPYKAMFRRCYIP